MKITRDGKTYTLTPAELRDAFEEERMNRWRGEIALAIDRNSDKLNFGLTWTVDEFIRECVNHLDSGEYNEEDDEHFDEVVFDMAEFLGVWKDEGDEDEI